MPRIKIENKHTYQNIGTYIDGAVLTPTAEAFRQNNTVFRYFEPVWPVQGDDSDDRTGRKIMTTSLISEGFLEFRNGNAENTMGDVYDGYISELHTNGGWGQNYEVNPLNWPLDCSIRHMFVEFDPDVISGSNANIYDLFRQWFLKLFIKTGNDAIPSNRMEVLRESTDWTGKFKILYDKVHHINFQHPIVHYKVNLPYKRQLNFDSTTVVSSPTNKRVYELFIGPTNLNIDYGSKSFGDHVLATSTAEATFHIHVAFLQSTLKLNFIDL